MVFSHMEAPSRYFRAQTPLGRKSAASLTPHPTTDDIVKAPKSDQPTHPHPQRPGTASPREHAANPATTPPKMSPELEDEIEALNSIYGPSTLAPADDPDTYVLHLPGAARSSLRLVIPASYPDAPPEAHSTFSIGAAARPGAELALFREALATAFAPGMVCLYDAIEELSALLSAQPAPSPEPAREPSPAEEEEEETPTVAWTLSTPITELKSTFLAHVTPVTHPSQVPTYLSALLSSDRRIRQATHNISAWRIRGSAPDASFQDHDDDGEAAAGGRLLHLLQAVDAWDVLVVVSRWYGGLKLGPRRFALINSAARDGLVKAGFVREEKKGKGKA